MNFFRLEGVAIGKASAAAPGARWNQLFPLGARHRTDFPGGKIDFTPKFLTTMVENWKRMGGQALPADYLHRGDADGNLPVHEKVASGWIEDLELRDDGLWGLFQWTDRARAYIAADELRYLSPTFATDATDRNTGKPQGPTLYGCALLNTPFLTDLPRVAASATAVPPAQPTPAPVAKERIMDKLKLCTLLAIALDAGDDVIASRLQSLKDGEAKANAELLKLQAVNTESQKLALGVEPLKLQLATLTAEKTELAAKLSKLELEREAEGVKALTAELLKDGKITAAHGDQVAKYAKATSLADARTFFSAFPAGTVVKLGEVGVSGTKDDVTAETAKEQYRTLMDGYAEKGLNAQKSLAKLKKEHAEVFKFAFTPTLTKQPDVG